MLNCFHYDRGYAVESWVSRKFNAKMGASAKENILPFSLLCRLRRRKSSNDNYSYSLIVPPKYKAKPSEVVNPPVCIFGKIVKPLDNKSIRVCRFVRVKISRKRNGK